MKICLPEDFEEEPKAEEREHCVWGSINAAFSEPLTRADDVAEYAPTQVLAEAFRAAGYDGIVYGSKLGTGNTVAIFDLTAADLANCHLYRVKAVKLEFDFAANPYFVTKYCNQCEPKDAAASGADGTISEPAKE